MAEGRDGYWESRVVPDEEAIAECNLTCKKNIIICEENINNMNIALSNYDAIVTNLVDKNKSVDETVAGLRSAAKELEDSGVNVDLSAVIKDYDNVKESNDALILEYRDKIEVTEKKLDEEKRILDNERAAQRACSGKTKTIQVWVSM